MKAQAVQNAKYLADLYHLNYSVEILKIVFGIITVVKKYFVSFLKKLGSLSLLKIDLYILPISSLSIM